MAKSGEKKKRKRVSFGDNDSFNNDSFSSGSFNRRLTQFYSGGMKMKLEEKDEKDKLENDSQKEIDKALKKRIRLKEKYLLEAKATFDDFGGLDEIIEELKLFLNFESIESNIKDIANVANFRKRLLIQGVAGVGKSKLVEAIANYLNIPCLKCNLRRISSGSSAEVDSAIPNLFNLAKSLQPCILYIDKLEYIAKKREAMNSAEKANLVLENLIDSLEDLNNDESNILVIGVTNSIESVDLEFLDVAGFTEEVNIDIPDYEARKKILDRISRGIKFESDVDLNHLAFNTPGYVGADLKRLIEKACLVAAKRLLRTYQITTKCVTNDDISLAYKQTKPSLKRNDFASIPLVTWNDIGGLQEIRIKLRTAVLYPVKYSGFMKATIWEKSCGILLHGPPGCGKTSIAKALANEGGINFISIRGPEVLNMYVGESERKIRSIFERAAKAKPCVIFFDEIDALCKERSNLEVSEIILTYYHHRVIYYNIYFLF